MSQSQMPRRTGAIEPPRAGAIEIDDRLDKVLLFAVLALLGLGLVMVYSASADLAVSKNLPGAHFFKRQLIAAAIGLAGMLAVLKLGYRRLVNWSYPVLLGTMGLLLLVLAVGKEAGGATRWLQFGSVSVQPGEFAKLAFILYLAYSLAKKRDKVKDFTIGMLPHLFIGGLLVGISIAQDDLGTAIILCVLLFALLFTAGTKLSYLFITAFGALLLLVLQIILTPWRMERMKVFFDSSVDSAAKYNITESLVTFGSGRWFGLGLGDGRQKLSFLPAAHNDFIFAVIGEELGFVGVLLVVGLLAVVVWRGFRAAFNATEAFGAYLAFGVTLLIAVQSTINVLVAMDFAPAKGLTLPFISYGGTSLMVMLVAVGLLLSVGQGRGGFLKPQKGAPR